ncbi:MAG: N-acetyltransferase [Lentisphaerae bacterium]|nr:N-acetyltransferase [Lentisphaerota bacterium]
MTDVTIRLARTDDLAEIVTIYNQAILLKSATADTSPVSVQSREQWLADHRPETYPVYVSTQDEAVTGWCSLSPYRPGREALRFTAEVSYYVHEVWRRQGIGRALLQHAVDECPRLGLKTLFALLLEINTPSVALLESLGFGRWGFMPGVADFDGSECGHLVYGRRVVE